MTIKDSANQDSVAQPRFGRHILVCVNQRGPDSSKLSCGACGDALRLRFVDLIARHGLKGQVRASKVHCLDACELGPVVLIYSLEPSEVHRGEIWYVGVSPEDSEAIFTASVLGNGVYSPRLAHPDDWARLRASRAAEKSQKQRKIVANGRPDADEPRSILSEQPACAEKENQ